MATTTIKPMGPGGLARTFVEYALLPDLLSQLDALRADGIPQSWPEFFSEQACHLEHLLDEDMPSDDDIPTYLAADAWHLARQLQLVSDRGLTQEGQAIAEIAGMPLAQRETPLKTLLAQRVETCYLGQGGLSITELLQRGAGRLASHEHDWASYCPGLLLVEFEALAHLAVTDEKQAIILCDEGLLQNRDTAMHAYDMPSPDQLPMHNTIRHADAVAEFYIEKSELLKDDGMGISTARATVILLTFCGLLQEVNPLGPVQCLEPVPMDESRHA